MRVNVWIPDKLLEELDNSRAGRSRSALISELISARLSSKPAKGLTKKTAKEPAEKPTKKVVKVCKHGARIGLCKFNCKS